MARAGKRIKRRVETQWIPLNRLKVHPEVQRGLNETRVDELSANMNLDAIGLLAVIPYRDWYYVFDGQHRLRALERFLDDNTQMIECEVFPRGLTLKEAAQTFLDRNNQLGQHPLGKWIQRRNAEEPVVLEIEAILGKYGLSVESGPEDGNVRAVVALEAIYDNHSAAGLDKTVGVLYAAWGADYNAYHHALLRGLALVLHTYEEQIDAERFAKKLSKNGGPARMLGQAREFARGMHVSLARAAAQRFVNEYNVRRTRDRLPAVIV